MPPCHSTRKASIVLLSLPGKRAELSHRASSTKERYCLCLPLKKASIVLLVLSWQKGGTFLSKRTVFLLSSLLCRKAVWGLLLFLDKNAVLPLLFLVGKWAVSPTLSKARNYPLVLSWQKSSIAPLLKGPLIPPWLTCYSHCPITAEHSMCECMCCFKYFFIIMIIQFGWVYK